ncbi:MAG: hypothetical protein E7Z94_01345 [Actinomyces ruminicola]|uniref:DUF5067 domain-containing protein n=1 Tax=Actinomyces ruminicola TaxID=332524 RepID=A0A1G9TLB7_9ACTO|nr:hypothetical protein [Actinomyces ruminicola]MBE6481024.1 hypothetical protein [Actinomyces ruminicola]SDM48463.1 hypothetical protein SAMN04487766_10344 [Actinomyces ruminicola]
MLMSSFKRVSATASASSQGCGRRHFLALGGSVALVGALAACGLTRRGGDDGEGAGAAADVASAAAQASAAGTALPFTGELPVLGSQETELNNGSAAEEPARVDLNAVTVTGGFTIVTFSVTSLSPDDDDHEGLYPTTSFGLSTTAGVTIIDGLNQKTYETARNTDGDPLCSRPGRIRPGDTAIYYNMYAPLPENVETVTISIPGLQLFTDVAVTR